MSRRQLTADAALLAVVIIWGTTFVLIQNAVRDFPTFPLLALRFWTATAAFAPILLYRRWRRVNDPRPGAPARTRQQRILPLVWIGLALTAGYYFQTQGLLYTTPAKSGFITGLSVVFVPIGAAVFFHQRIEAPAIFGVVLATVGLALLSLNATMTVNFGDVLTLVCAVAFAAHILLVGKYAPHFSPWTLGAGQILVAASASTLLALLTWPVGGLPPITANVVLAVLISGLLGTAFAFTVQSAAQRFTTATHTALIFSLEPVAAGVSSYILIGEVLTPRALLGCALIFAGALTAEFWSVVRRPRRKPAAAPVQP